MRKRSCLSLKKGCYLVKGSKRAAIYDTNRRKIYSISEKFLRFLWNIRGDRKEDTALYGLLEEVFQSFSFIEKEKDYNPNPSIEEVLIRDPSPSGVWFDITEACNLRCIHCYATAGRPLNKELTLGEWQQVIDDLVSAGHLWFTLAGGEPFVKKDLPEILQHLVEKAEQVVIITNATLIKERPEVINFISRHRDKISLLISFYSYLPENHERVTMVKGSWQRSVKGIKEVIKRELPYNINIPLCTINEDDLERTLDFLEELGVDRHRAGGNVVYPMGRGCNQEILPSEWTKFSLKRPEYNLPLTGDGRLIYKSCWTGKLLIMADGRVSPCPSARDEMFVVGNIREDPISKILKSRRLNEFWQITLDDVNECSQCEFRYACHDCRPTAYAWTGNYLAKNPYCLYKPKEGEWQPMPVKEDEKITSERYRPNPAFKSRIVDDELCLYTLGGNSVHLLNQVAAEVYSYCSAGLKISEVIERLTSKYDASAEEIKRDVLQIIQEMQEKKIIEKIDEV